uniref:Ndwfamide 1 n=1 Tax=Deroceras reticulatum TaxID=145610 RepID=A0A1X9WEE9_DERRE|nr:ndwfamide 1 [Deroceras reticulatum]
MSRAVLFVIALIVSCSFISAPVHANWFGKRGDKEDLFNLLLQQPQQDSLVGAQEWDTESALLAIESIARAWRSQQSDKLAKNRQG